MDNVKSTFTWRKMLIKKLPQTMPLDGKSIQLIVYGRS